MEIPDLKKIMKPNWSHKPGYGWSVKIGGLMKHKILEQSTTPQDKRLLEKLGIKRGERVLAIAGYYASWASQLAKNKADVDYSDISKSMVNYAKTKYKNLFGKYICSNYELIPEKENQYDWTFTFEACGGAQGLPIAYLRSLLNKKGGIMVLYFNFDKPEHMGGKWKTYPMIVKKLSEIYGTRYKVKKIRISGHKKGCKNSSLVHRIYIIYTNERARKLVKIDLENLEKPSDKKDIETLESLRRLNKVSKLVKQEFRKELK